MTAPNDERSTTSFKDHNDSRPQTVSNRALRLATRNRANVFTPLYAQRKIQEKKTPWTPRHLISHCVPTGVKMAAVPKGYIYNTLRKCTRSTEVLPSSVAFDQNDGYCLFQTPQSYVTCTAFITITRAEHYRQKCAMVSYFFFFFQSATGFSIVGDL